MSDYINKFQTEDYYIQLVHVKGETLYGLYNKFTSVLEFTTPMLPQAVLNMYNFQNALDDIISESDTDLPDNAIKFPVH